MTSLEPSFVAHYNLEMGFQPAYKRNQVEEAILATVSGDGRGANGPDLRVRMKRLLDADRLLSREEKSADPEGASYAFYSGDAPGSGVEVWFSPYEAFALQIALRLLGHGWPQGTVVRLMREVRWNSKRSIAVYSSRTLGPVRPGEGPQASSTGKNRHGQHRPGVSRDRFAGGVRST